MTTLILVTSIFKIYLKSRLFYMFSLNLSVDVIDNNICRFDFRFMISLFFWIVHRFARSSHWRCSIKKVFLEISQNSQENTSTRVSFLSCRPKKRLWYTGFPVNFVKFLRTPILQNTSGRLLLYSLILKSWKVISWNCVLQIWSLKDIHLK